LTTVGGVKLALLPKKNRGEAVTVELRMHYGDEKNLFGKGAVAGLTGAMLMRGTTRYDRVQLADAFDRLKISGSTRRFETTRSNLAEAMRLVAHVLKEPAFPATEFEQLRQQLLVGLESGRGEPQEVAGRALGQHFNLYPRGDVRAATSIDDDIADLKAAKLEQLRAFHGQYYGAAPAEMAIVGDFDAATVVPLVEELFGKWKAPANVAPILSRHAEVAPIQKMIDTPDKENGFYTGRINLDLNQDDKDYPALMLANYIFGEGGLKSRLIDRIRQKDGLSYGGSSELVPGSLDRAGMFEVTAIAAPQNLRRVDTAVRQELARALKDGFTAAELAGAKSGLMQQRVQNRSDDSALAAGWATYLYRGRTFEWSREFENKLMAVTLPELNAAFSRAIDPAKLSVVMAGDSSKAGNGSKAAAVP
jgi:zinc protease